MPSNHLILCRPLLFPPSIFPSSGSFPMNQFFASGGHSFSFSISLSTEYSGLISSSIDRLDLLTVQGTLKSLFQHHSSTASLHWCSAFFIVQLSHPYMTIGKTIALTRRTFVGKVVSLLFNMLSRLVITFLPRSKQTLLSHKEEWNIAICDNLDRPTGPYAKWNKSDGERQILYDFT